MRFLPRRSIPTIRSRLVRLVLACALPILAGYFVFATDAEQRERAHVAEDAGMIADALAAAVDRDLASSETAARTLAGGPALAAGDLASFQASARRLLRPEYPAYSFELSGPDGNALVDTRHPYGSPVPPNGNEDDVRAVFATGESVISGLHRANAAQPWLISIAVPVWQADRVRYALSVQLRPRGLAELLANQHLPAHWTALVFDNRGRLVAQNGAAEHAAGEPMSPPLARAAARAGAGVVVLDQAGHRPMFAAYARTPVHGWTVAIGYPRQAARELLGSDPGASLAWIALMLGTSLLLAWRIGGSIAHSVRALTGPAAALGRGEPITVPPLGIREAAAVAQALTQVERELVDARSNLEARVAERTMALQRSSAMLHTVYATAPVGLGFLDRELRFVMINDYLARLNAKPAEAHVGHTLAELLGERGVAMEQPYRQVLATGRPLIDVEQSADTAAQPGVMRHWVCSYYPVYGPARDLVGINVVVIDITERKLQEERNRDNEELFRALFEGSSDAHVLAAHGAGFVSANGAAVRMFGYASLDEVLALSPASVSPEFQPDGQRSDAASHANMRRALDEGVCQFEWVHRRRDGSLFHADVLLNRVDIGGRGIVHATIRDITDLKRTQSQLEEALRAAQSASSAKSEFLANMSHEIRTPMNAIIGLARLLEEASLGRRERAQVARIGMAAKSLLSMLNDVLDYSKVEAGQLALEATPFQLDDVLASIAVLSANGAWNKGIEPVFAVAPDVPARLVGDPMRLEQVLLNLVSNAIKFTDSGEVVLAITVQAADDAGVRLAFAVRDTGIGIAREQQQRMFEAFSQADTSTSRKYGGTGLGLAISRRLVDLMGGHLEVESAPGAGATFRFSAPFGMAAPPDLAGLPAGDAAPPDCAVLVADDNASSRAALAALLAGYGWRVDAAAGGAEALARLRAGSAAGGRPYDLAFLDSAMPDLDGVSVLSYARADKSLALPRCTLLAPDPDRDRLEALAGELRIDCVLAKPFTPAQVRQAAAALLACAHAGAHAGAQQGAPAPATRAPLSARLAGLRVLVVEDNMLNQEVANYVLVHAGASVDFAGNGRVAVSMLGEARERYDAVLMDVQMPVMDGYAATAAIRALGMTDLPIVAMTANALDEDRRRALAAGMDDYVAKPIDVDELVAKLNRLVQRRPGDAAPPAALPAPAAPGVAIPGRLPGIDLKTTLARFGGRYADFAALLKRFAASYGGAAAEIRTLLGHGERTAAAQAAHRLRGVAANLGATEVAQQALDLEAALRSEDAAALAVRLARLDAALRVVLDGAAELDAPAAPGPEAPRDNTGSSPAHVSRAALAHLLDLLQNNNMKALAHFDALRPTLARMAPDRLPPLADAVATLRFDAAARLVRDWMDTPEST